MDIVTRLKIFLDKMDIPNSQFADNCGIPRPTISQVLNGRNKKISDELISKIHASYPALSVMWLLFGEGDMVTDSNIKFSESQNDVKSAFNHSQSIEGEISMPHSNSFENDSEIASEKKIKESSAIFSSNRDVKPAAELKIEKERGGSTVSIPTESLKKITNIVVFYNDNSFQSFNPSQL